MSVELDIINDMISTTGVAAVTSLESRHPSVRKARPKLTRVNREIQNTGWWFNKDYKLGLIKNVTNEFILPGNTLWADPSDDTKNYVKRGNRMYDPDTHKYDFAEDVGDDPLEVTLVFLMPYDDLPQSAITYITALACRRYAMAENVDAGTMRELNNDYITARSEFKADHLKRLDLNALRGPQAVRARFRHPGTLLGSDATYIGGGQYV